MHRTARPFAAATLAVVLAFGGAACSDEDGDGATTDEEIGELDQDIDEGADELQQEVEEGQEEVDGEDG
jgi:hypothetical protein